MAAEGISQQVFQISAGSRPEESAPHHNRAAVRKSDRQNERVKGGLRASALPREPTPMVLPHAEESESAKVYGHNGRVTYQHLAGGVTA